MSNKTTEHLSSLMDGEVSQDTGQFLTRRLCADRELGETWERYHLIRDCMRSSGRAWSVSSVRMTLDGPGESAETVATSPRWLKPLSGLAIAASVALVAILAVTPDADLQGPVDTAQPFDSPNLMNVVPPSQPASLSGGADRERMNNYLLRHNQVGGSVGRQGFVALVPIVTTAQDTQAAADAADDADDRAAESVDSGSPQP